MPAPTTLRWLARLASLLTALTLAWGLYAWSRDSAAVLVLATTPLFAVVALAAGIASRGR